MNWQNFFGTMTMVLATAMSFVGLPAQIRKNYQEKRCGLPLTMMLLVFGVYTSRIGYALSIKSIFLLIPDTAGAVFSAIILFQYYQYKERTKS